MAVAKEAIIHKMTQQLAAAKEMKNDNEKMLQYIANVRLLCDLLLEEQQAVEKSPGIKPESAEISAAEWKTMLGSSAKPDIHKQQNRFKDDDDANGDSIFDF